ncbi:phosphoribosylamine--glycine ligase [Candidatus Parcubacteria bacterium]|nr:phosphoribosylamine--glycine ligase [Candidatus Parcubacteria bacterium]
MKKVLVVGSGGREHALAWRLAQSPQVAKVYIAPGNSGTALVGENVDINFTDSINLLNFAKQNNIDLTVIGQEAASEAGVVDVFQDSGLAIFGPTKKAALIESSKAFSKELMREQNIPTAEFKSFDDPVQAKKYIKTKEFPQVIKADGLATGKGVTICYNFLQAEQAIDDIMVRKIFGESGNKVVVEDFLSGQEISIHVLADGKNCAVFPPSQDHKQIYDSDKGPNTGGMGVIAPVDLIDDSQLNAVVEKVVKPALTGLAEKKSQFVGCLYPGLMVNNQEINVIEFNARFGDPEAEVYMRLIDGDLYEILYSCTRQNLQPLKWRNGYAVSVVLASAGYPGSSDKGKVIHGINEAEKMPDIIVFHAGTAKDGDNFVTAGGRVLNVTAIGKTRNEAIDKAYQAVKLIHFDGMQYRTDIGRRLAPQ